MSSADFAWEIEGLPGFLVSHQSDDLIQLYHKLEEHDIEHWHQVVVLSKPVATDRALRAAAEAHLKTCRMVVESSM